MPIASANVDICLFMTEVSLQCNLAERAAARLEKARFGWLRDALHDHRAEATPPIEIIEDVHLLLLAGGIVSKILFGATPKTTLRAARLRELMALPELPALSSRKVRNSYEHIDERLDELTSRLTNGGSICPLMVDDKEPDENTIVLKRFCPRTTKVYFEDDFIDLSQLVNELSLVREGINAAYAVMEGTREKLL